MFEHPYLRQPTEVSLETLALCNARCTFCPYPTLDRKGVQMDDQLIHRLLCEMSVWERPFFISPFKVNEPLLDLRLPDICATIEKCVPKASIRLFTNGTPLTSHHLEWINRLTRLEHLWISLNEVEPKRYFDTMGLTYRVIESRLDKLHEWKQVKDFNHPVVISRVSDGDGRHASVADKHFERTVLERWPLFAIQLIKRDSWLGFVKPGNPEIPQTKCGRWFELNIMATGKAALCCMDGTGEYSIGDVNDTSLLELYNQPHLLARRQHAATRAGIEPCQRCSY